MLTTHRTASIAGKKKRKKNALAIYFQLFRDCFHFQQQWRDCGDPETNTNAKSGKY